MRTSVILGSIVVVTLTACADGGHSQQPPAVAGQDVQQSVIDEATAQPVAPINARSEEFQHAGDEIRAAQAERPELRGAFEPFITDPIDITEPGEYRIPLLLPPGTSSHDVALMGPGDLGQYVSMNTLRLEPEGVAPDGVMSIVLDIAEVRTPYYGYQMWVQ